MSEEPGRKPTDLVAFEDKNLQIGGPLLSDKLINHINSFINKLGIEVCARIIWIYGRIIGVYGRIKEVVLQIVNFNGIIMIY